MSDHCQCQACKDGVVHSSDCAVHNMPASPNGICDCGALIHTGIENLDHWLSCHCAIINSDDKIELLSIVSQIIKEAAAA